METIVPSFMSSCLQLTKKAGLNPSETGGRNVVVDRTRQCSLPAAKKDCAGQEPRRPTGASLESSSSPTSRRGALIVLLGASATRFVLDGFSTGPPAACAAPTPSTEGSSSWATEQEVREAVRSALTPAKSPGVLRLVFHDAGTFDLPSASGGMNGSVLFELERPESNGLKRYTKFLDGVREALRSRALGVSWADLIAVAGAEAVELCGGPSIPVRVGREDSRSADAPDRMPAETFDADQVIQSFGSKGFSVQEAVALLGAHTLGGKGFGDPTVFDSAYFRVLLQRPWNNKADNMASMIGLPSDRAIVESREAEEWIRIYANDEARFFADFAVAYTKLVDSGAKWRAAA